jgi:hypothetical protein
MEGLGVIAAIGKRHRERWRDMRNSGVLRQRSDAFQQRPLSAKGANASIDS